MVSDKSNSVSDSYDDEWNALKEEGNKFFQLCDYDHALISYSKALQLSQSSHNQAILHKNRAAVYLKMKKYQNAEEDATSALEIAPNDPKSLFRRCLAREQLGNYSGAFEDAKKASVLERNNKHITAALQRLAVIVQDKQREAASTQSRTSGMLKIAFDCTANNEKRITAMNNLLVLCREGPAAEILWNADIADQLASIYYARDVGDANSVELSVSALRVLDELLKDGSYASALLEKWGASKLLRMMNVSNKETVLIDITSNIAQRVFNALSGMDRSMEKAADANLCEKNKIELVRFNFELKSMLIDSKVSAESRDAVVDFLLKNLMHMDKGLPRGWSWRFVEDEGLKRLLEVAANATEKGYLPTTKETRDHLAICLSRLYEDMVFDKQRELYQRECEAFVKYEMLQVEKGNENAKLRVVSCVTALLHGPFDVGFSLIGSHSMTDLMLEMASSSDVVLQSVAVEAIVETASKRERCSAILAQGLPVLKRLFESDHQQIKARALVGLCKCASSGGSDISRRAMAEGSTLKLAEYCKKLIINRSVEDADDIGRWAAEGLSYLTLDADVKDWLTEDASVIRALVELSQSAGSLVVYGVASIFVNLCNANEKEKVDEEEELKKLAKFSKHHVPQPHEKDALEFVDKRIKLLVSEGATSACVAFSKTDSYFSKELIAKALCAFTKQREHRGTVVQEGGAKILVNLANEGTEAGKTFAAWALAKIGVTIDPNIAFPGQRSYECVRPLVNLLHPDRSGLQNYEALLTLTNLASMSDSVRKRIIKEKAWSRIEEYWFMTEHQELRAAAAECILNLLHCDEALQIVLQPSADRLRLLTLYAGDEEDSRLALASAAGLTIVTAKPEACVRISKEVGSWLEIFRDLIVRDDPELQYRGMAALDNMMHADYDVAARLMQSEVFEYLVAMTKIGIDPARQRSQRLAESILKHAEKLELIKPTDRELYERIKVKSCIEEQ